MVSLYKYRGQVDLIVTDPPYNTGEDFRYNDRWDEDPNDPDLGALVPAEDGSRHSKWLRFMVPRLWMRPVRLSGTVYCHKASSEGRRLLRQRWMVAGWTLKVLATSLIDRPSWTSAMARAI